MIQKFTGFSKLFRSFCSINNNSDQTKQVFLLNNRDSRWLYLLQQDIRWNEVQDIVETAALLSSEVDRVGWYIQPANTSKKSLDYVDSFFKYSEDIELTSKTLDSVIGEFIELIKSKKDVKMNELPKIEKVHDDVLKEVNEFLKSRGQQTGWSMDQYLEILNHNLRLITQQVQVDNLPPNDDISIELIYGYMISHYGVPFLNACPQIAVLMVCIPFINANRDSQISAMECKDPKKLKLESFQKAINTKKNLPFEEEFYFQKFKDVFDLSQTFKNQLKLIEENKNNPKKYSRKSINRLKKFIRLIDVKYAIKQERYEVRLLLVQQHYEVNSDYRTLFSQGWEVFFYEAIKQGLNRLPTCITILNNGTLRNPSKHLVTRFLYAQNDSLRNYLIEQQSKSQQKLEEYALIVRRARQQNYVISDWQNKIARQWSQQRSKVLKHIQYQIQANNAQKLRVPPPFQYCLALDLNPEFHPFSFTYSRKQGYCVDFQSSIKSFVQHYNPSEKGYFYSILENPDCNPKFSFLKEIPDHIRIPPQIINDKNQELQYLLGVDKWLEENSQSEDLQIIKEINLFIDQKIAQLPPYLLGKVNNFLTKKVSVMGLFDLMFQIHFPEEVYLDKINLPYPKQLNYLADPKAEGEKEEIFQPINPLIFNSVSELLGFWGPPQYGGRVNTKEFGLYSFLQFLE